MKNRILSYEEALEKAKNYCAYQERCLSDMRTKLTAWGINKKEQEKIIQTLLAQNFIDELRYARLFAEGKSRINAWGKQKIIYALRSKKINDNHIQQAITNIELEDYQKTLAKNAEKYIANHTFVSENERKQKLIRYLLSKGFEYAAIQEYLENKNNL
ncbi:MAG TPA: regulatory protein RecX [Bacteroidales bacterium]|nr:regulatory protein RecX [Bacteroidales bacterium]HQB20003.1 regulatory protein RecX [Bacteroidales bacterium]